MALLENIPAVLHSLIEGASKPENKQTQPADARSQDGEDNAEIKSKKEISATLLDPDRNTVTRECTHNSNNGPLPYASSEWPHLTVMFTNKDERHNRRVLQQAARQGRISGHKYKEASEAMTEYRTILMERMQSFVRGYLMKVSWNQAETLLKKQSFRSPQVLPVLTKLRIQKQQALMRWKEERVRSWEKRLHLSASLDLTLQELQQESGIFLIKPVLSWPRRSQLVKNQRQNHSTCKDFSKSTWLPSYQSKNQDSLRCCGKAPRPLSREWSVLQNHEALRPLVITPKVLEMDIHRYLCKECCVMSKHQSSPIGSTQKSGSPLRNYLVVKRTTPLLSFNYEVGITKFND
ncbi:uncharacterized protein LOC128663182 [Bombina bombina]|uniref:uncharacterized protein LOC128663182 n=1 Tax=Bombina bombina TaxID=8345 RepID=UPI00235A670A|nr:uncharacterized protein LOC128663182 [Bombina bombina]